MTTTAYACDRCRTDCTIDPNRNHLVLVAGNLTPSPRTNRFDLCGPCVSDLAGWLDVPPCDASSCTEPTEPVSS